MVQSSQLKEGFCKVVAVAHGKTKLFKGYYNPEKQHVFIINIPHFYIIKGYIQN